MNPSTFALFSLKLHEVRKKIADKVALLKDGMVIWIDNLENTLNSNNEYVKLFLDQHS